MQAIVGPIAAMILWALTGRRFGCCEVTVRPCKPEGPCDRQSFQDVIYWDNTSRLKDSSSNLGVLNFFPTLIDGSTFNISCGCKQGCCTCKADCEVFLPGPVCEIVGVNVNGFELEPADYQLFDHHKLVIRRVWQPSTKAGRLIATAAPHDTADRWTYSPNPVGPPVGIQTNHVHYPDNTWGPSNSFGQYYNVFPTLPNSSITFTYTAGPGPQHPKGFAIAPSFDPVNSPSCAYEWNTVTYPIGTVLNPGDSIVTSTISDPDCDDGSRYRLTVLTGTGTTTSARAMDMSDNFSARVDFFERGQCPPCQDYNKPLGEVNTWSVTYKIGEPLPPGANLMAGLYACELAKALVSDTTCALPANLQALSRQGIDLAFADPFRLAEKGLVGIPFIDLWIKSLNPYGLAQRGRVWSPDIPIVRREH